TGVLMYLLLLSCLFVGDEGIEPSASAIST
ncbi:hypothetical protein LCGC14_2905170, partial [marine sediment metagenome]